MPSRLDEMRDSGILPAIPATSAPHIVEWLLEIGPGEAAGMGLAPLGWGQIDAWCSRTGIDLPPWQFRLLRRLSAAYVTESRRAEDPNAPPPWQDAEAIRENRDVVAKAMRLAMASFMAPRG
jgi:hypothetical protein